MTQTKAPTVVFIDDHEDELRPLAALVQGAGMAGCKVDSPEDVDNDLLERADLVVVDYTLDKWKERDELSQLSLKPMNGVALASVLREHYRGETLRHAPPTGFALITGDPNSISTSPGERRPHVVARLSNLEWYFEKHTDSQHNADRIVSLAKAIHSLPSEFSKQMVEIDQMMGLLGVNEDHPLFERYRDDVKNCRPPVHHLSQESGGLVLIRWLLHRILPHTSFLIDEWHLAARLRVTPNSLREQLKTNGEFTRQLNELRYTGLLAEFDQFRWWRGGIEQWLWDLTAGESANATSVHESLRSLGAEDLVGINLPRPVVTLDEHLQQEEDLSAMSEVVAIQLDDWPSYAEPAYVRKDLLSEHKHLELFAVDGQ